MLWHSNGKHIKAVVRELSIEVSQFGRVDCLLYLCPLLPNAEEYGRTCAHESARIDWTSQPKREKKE